MTRKKIQRVKKNTITQESRKTGIVGPIIAGVVIALLVGTAAPWWWHLCLDIDENDANELLSNYLEYVQEEAYEKMKNLYLNFDNCKSCQQDLENLRSFKGKNMKIITKEFSSQEKLLRIKIEWGTGTYYEPTFYLSKTKLLPIHNICETKIIEVRP